MTSQSGEQLYKSVRLKIFTPENKKAQLQILRAPRGQAFHPNGIERILRNAADQIEAKWPTEQYALVALAPNAFNFVWREHLGVAAS